MAIILMIHYLLLQNAWVEKVLELKRHIVSFLHTLQIPWQRYFCKRAQTSLKDACGPYMNFKAIPLVLCAC
jgi:hypothetical protein